MKEMNMERRVYEAAIKGDVRALRALIQEDELVLDRVTLNCFNETPLHIAAMRGHVEFAGELLGRNPQLASELDSRKSSPLHVAAVKGDLEMVKLLLSANPEMCLASDRDGRNPLHLAAMKGRVEVVKELLMTAEAVQQRTDSGRETVLHLCVKHNQIEALKTLMASVEQQIITEIMNATDAYGNTILHLAVSDKQIETIKYLLSNSQLAVNSINGNGYTPLDILSQGLQKHTNDFDIGEILRDAGALKAKEIPSTHHHHQHQTRTTNNNIHQNPAGDWLSRKRDSIMVVASLIATMAFQAGVNPPGGVWQENSPPNSAQPHIAGEATMAYSHAKAYRYFVRTNTTAFVASLSTILLLISGLPFRRRFFLWGLMVIMWLTVTTIALSYGISIVIITPKQYRAQISNVIQISVTVWCCVMSLLLFGNTVRLIFRWMRKTEKIGSWRPQKKSSTTTTSVYTNV